MNTIFQHREVRPLIRSDEPALRDLVETYAAEEVYDPENHSLLNLTFNSLQAPGPEGDSNSLLIGVFQPSASGAVLDAVARLRFHPGPAADVAWVIRRGFRTPAFKRFLLEQLAAQAARRGLSSLRLRTMARNLELKGLLQSYESEPRPLEDAELVEYTLGIDSILRASSLMTPEHA